MGRGIIMPDDAIVVAPVNAVANVAEKLPAPTPQDSNETEMIKLVPTAGTVALTDKQKAILYDDIPEDEVEIRPDGLIYVPWMGYVSRLRDAFGLGWSIVPKGMPMVKGDLICWGWWMLIDGKLAGFAIGEQKYRPNNATMSWGDACEGAKSNALMRLCKGLGIGLELWSPSFIRKWKEKYAESFMEYNKLRWRKKASEPISVIDPLTCEFHMKDLAPQQVDNQDFDAQMDKESTHAHEKPTTKALSAQINTALSLNKIKGDDKDAFMSFLFEYQVKKDKCYVAMGDDGKLHFSLGFEEHLRELVKILPAAIKKWKLEQGKPND